MVPNVGRKIVLIASILAISLFFYLLPMLQGVSPIRLGLDLQGGTRLVYQVLETFDEEDDQAPQSKQQKLDESIAIIRDRIDPQGVLNITIQRQGSDRLLVELPGLSPQEARSVEKLITELGKLQLRIVAFNDTGSGGDLTGIDVDIEASRNKLKAWWDSELARGGESYVDETTINRYNVVSESLGGPQRGFLWVALDNPPDPPSSRDGHPMLFKSRVLYRKGQWAERKPDTGEVYIYGGVDSEGRPAAPTKLGLGYGADFQEAVALELRRSPTAKATIHGNHIDVVLLRDEDDLNPDKRWVFTGQDLSASYQTSDRSGYPAVGFVFSAARADAFASFTETFTNHHMAIVLNDRAVSAPVIQGRLPGSGIIQGSFTSQEVRDLQRVLQSGSLQVPLEQISRNSMGPTLGQDAIERGSISALIGILVVILFMFYYYRRSGRIAALSLLYNMVILLGALAVFRVNLNLPGIAGLILTLGMAVDANILIFERIREERRKQRTPLQSAKNGFDRAFVTILDANITTLITTLILYWIGTGPIRGFAVVLALGILTSMFSALVFSRILIHFLLKRENFTDFEMRLWVPPTTIPFTRYMGGASLVSLVVVLSGLLLFMAKGSDLYGIDFLGGGTFRVGLRDELPLSQVRQRFESEFDSVQVYTLDDPSVFGVKIKLDPERDPERQQDISSKPGIQIRQAGRKTAMAELGALREDYRFEPVEVSLQFGNPIREVDLSDIRRALFEKGFIAPLPPSLTWLQDVGEDTQSKLEAERDAKRFFQANFYLEDVEEGGVLHEAYTPREPDPGSTGFVADLVQVEPPQLLRDPQDSSDRRLFLTARVPVPRFQEFGLDNLIHRALRPRYPLGLEGIEKQMRSVLRDLLSPDFLASDRGLANVVIAPVTVSFDLVFEQPVAISDVHGLLRWTGIRNPNLTADGQEIDRHTIATRYAIEEAESRWIEKDQVLEQNLRTNAARLADSPSLATNSFALQSVTVNGWSDRGRPVALDINFRGDEPPTIDALGAIFRAVGIDFDSTDLTEKPESNAMSWELRNATSRWLITESELREAIANEIVRRSPTRYLLAEMVTLNLLEEPGGGDAPEDFVSRVLRDCNLIVGEDNYVEALTPTTYTYDVDTPRTHTLDDIERVLTAKINLMKNQGEMTLKAASPFADASELSPQASLELRDSAVLALIISLFAITLYIRVRFYEFRFAFGAVIALFHDVMVVTGIVVLFGSLGLVDIEIDLTLVAALLTIIGYSLNDTIVIYDRIRENLPRMNAPLERVVNVSINETLSRTLLTSITTLFTVSVLFIANYGLRNALEGFSFAIIVGIISGTYSTVFIASPFLLWVERRQQRLAAAAAGGQKAQPATA